MPNQTLSPERARHELQPTRDTKYPEFSTKQQRLKTFVALPGPGDSSVQQEELADEGFFYDGETDSVRCFQCGGECNNWKDGYKAISEHTRLHPHCSYPRLANRQDRADQIPTQNAEPSKRNQEKDVVSPKCQICGIEQQPMEACGTRSEGIIERCFACGNEFKSLDADRQALGTHSAMYPSSPHTPRKTQVLDTGQDLRRRLSNYFAQGATRNRNRPTNKVDPCDVSISRSDIQTETQPKSELEIENRRLKDALQCKLCLESERGVIFLPCGHFCLCLTCAQGINMCLICKQVVDKIVVPNVD